MDYYAFVYRITDKMFKNTPLAILVWAIGGTYIVHLSNLTLDSDAWFWFFSTIAQTFAALITLIAAFYFFGIKLVITHLQILSKKNQLEEVDNSVIEQQVDDFKNNIKKLLNTTLLILIVSIILLPFGSPKIENNWLLEILNTYKLKYITLFSVIGLCVSSLYNMLLIFKKFLEDQQIQK